MTVIKMIQILLVLVIRVLDPRITNLTNGSDKNYDVLHISYTLRMYESRDFSQQTPVTTEQHSFRPEIYVNAI